MGAVTLSQVAQAAGVSLATASRVLNGSARTPGAGVAERVRDAAQALGYVANAQAQALARSSSGLLGLIVHDIADPYFSSIARGVQRVAQAEGRTLLLAGTDGGPAEERAALEVFASRRADAVVLAGSRQESPDNAALRREAERYLRNDGRLVLLGHALTDDASVLEIPHERLAGELADALIDDGARSFHLVGGPEGLLTSDQRLRGFRGALAARGLSEASLRRAAFGRDGGFAAGAALVPVLRESRQRGEWPVVFAANDRMAMGVAAALREQGLHAPSDYGLAGFDDIDTLRDFQPGLSTVHLPLEGIGAAAARVALGGEAEPVRGQVILRESTRRV
ncbi:MULTISPECIES: LacI family DNA-binding transcriptional regulator [Arthrobacter]|uniref:LacI family DNA-binding transcriptional regulator n=2 Tax=Arthrobacter TaxID=1663 RepID=A0ABU9KLW2_9MICC|nr:LacI family DNA-binding transcriptional regulator [Arthrobacter sp. YJM1]MDP5228177.1 LacI family DNA-binding transcriptional regulator [Arthrobacter sp. YJM1]